MKRGITYKDFKDNLKGEYKTVFEQIETYIVINMDDMAEKHNVLNDIVELLLTAQNDKTSIKRIIGNSIPKFCDDIIEAVSPKKLMKKQFSFLAFISVYTFCVMLIGASISSKGFKETIMASYNLLPYACGLITGAIYSSIAKRLTKVLMFRIKGFNITIYRIISAVVFFTLIIISFLAPYRLSVVIMISRYQIIIACMVYIIVFSIIKSIMKHQNREREGRTTEVNMGKISFKDDVHNKVIIAFRKRYNKANRKFMKKKNRSMNDEEAEKWLQKDSKNYKISWTCSLVVSIIFFTGMFINVFLTSPLYDSLIFLALIGVIVIYPLFLMFYHGRKIRLAILNELKEKEITIFDERIMRYPD